MPRRHADLPRLWLMTDPRQGEALWSALAGLPRGAGVVFRHHGVADRRGLYERVRRIARKRGLVLVLAGEARQAIAWRAAGVHRRTAVRVPPRLIHTAPAHARAELIAARRADLVFVSPVFATRSHPGTPALGRARLGLMAGTGRRGRIVALGGMNPRRAASLGALGIKRWAGIDALTPAEPGGADDQNLKAVPT